MTVTICLTSGRRTGGCRLPAPPPPAPAPGLPGLALRTWSSGASSLLRPCHLRTAHRTSRYFIASGDQPVDLEVSILIDKYQCPARFTGRVKLAKLLHDHARTAGNNYLSGYGPISFPKDDDQI